MIETVKPDKRLRWRQRKHGGTPTPDALIEITGNPHASLAQLAHYLNVTRSLLSALFANKRDMPTSFTRRVANALSVDVDAMMTVIERYARRRVDTNVSRHDINDDIADPR